MKKFILINLIFLSTLISGIFSMPMGLISKGASAGLSLPIARDMVDESKTFMTDIYTDKNYALRDKLYLYSSLNYENNENSYLSKMLIEQNFQFDKDSFIHVGGVVSYDDKNTKGRINGLYYDIDFFVNLLNIKLGREIKDFGYGGHFNIVDFLSKHNSIYNTEDMFTKRNSIDSLNVRINSTSGKNYMSIYAYENDITDDIEKSNYLLEVSTSGETFKSSMFINKSDNNLSVVLALKKYIANYIQVKTSIRYDKSEGNNEKKYKSLSSSSSFSYRISDGFLIGADYIAWKRDIKSDNKDIISHYMAYTKFNIASLKVKTGYLKDRKEKANLSFSYNISNIKLYLDGFIDLKDNDKNLARFMISYLH